MITLLTLLLACGDKEDDTTEVLDSGTNTDTSTDDDPQEEWIDGEWFDKGIYSGTITSDNKSYSVTLEVHESGRNVETTIIITDIPFEGEPGNIYEELFAVDLDSKSIFNALCSITNSEDDNWNFSCNQFSNISANGSGTLIIVHPIGADIGGFEDYGLNVEVNEPYPYEINSCNTSTIYGIDTTELNTMWEDDFCFEPIELTGNGFKDGFFLNATFSANPPYKDGVSDFSLVIGN